MIECKYRKKNCCQLVALYGNIDLDKTGVTDRTCNICLKTDSSTTGKCNRIIATMAISRVTKNYPERKYEIRDKLVEYRPDTFSGISVGPGTELKKIFNKIYIKDKGCNCNKHANAMNRWGCDKCLEQMDTIVGWLEDEAKKRGLPFSKIAAKAIVRLAVRRARKKENE